MVKVYKCHNFKSQNVIQVDNEPVALFAHQDKLFVATQNCCVFIYKFLANQKHQKTNAFATEARAQQLLFNNTGQTFLNKHYLRTIALNKHSIIECMSYPYAQTILIYK